MDLLHLIMSAIQVYGDSIASRNRIEKLVYFLSIILGKDDIKFEYNYFGPYSTEVLETLDKLIEIGFLDEERHSFSFNKDKRYKLFLTEPGQDRVGVISKIYKKDYAKIKKFTENLNSITKEYFPLMIASKVYYNLKKNGTPINNNTINVKLDNMIKDNWNITKNDRDKILKIIQLVESIK